MQTFYYFGSPSAIYLAALLLRSIGAPFKIKRRPYGDELITFGSYSNRSCITCATIKWIR